MKFRIEKDTMGEIKVPTKALWGAQTQRALDNFKISGILMNFPFSNTNMFVVMFFNTLTLFPKRS